MATYTLQIGIAGLRRGARKIAKAEGGTYSESEWLYRGVDKDGNPTDWQESWSVKRQGFPEAAKVIVTRDGAEFAHVVMWEEAVQTYKDGNPTPMWAGKPTFMLGKNAAAGAYRKAFPDEMSDMYVDSERFDSDDSGVVQASARRTDRRGGARAALSAAAQATAQEPEDAVVEDPVSHIIADLKAAPDRPTITEIMARDEVKSLDGADHDQVSAAANTRWQELA